jgi:transcriptional regulator with XRE-family HTH domain
MSLLRNIGARIQLRIGMSQQENTNAGMGFHEMREAHPVDHHVGHRLKLRRLALGLSQEQLGAAAGVTLQQIQKYEKGHNRISASRLYGFAQALNCPVEFFFKELPSQVTDEAVGDDNCSRIDEFIRSSEGLKLIEAFTRITQTSLRKAILRLVSASAGHENTAS